MVAGACSPLDRMYETPKLAIAPLFMAGNHNKAERECLPCACIYDDFPGLSPKFTITCEAPEQTNRCLLPTK